MTRSSSPLLRQLQLPRPLLLMIANDAAGVVAVVVVVDDVDDDDDDAVDDDAADWCVDGYLDSIWSILFDRS